MDGSSTNRKPHSGNAGYVSERKCSAGGHVVIYDREAGFDCDASDRWIVMHEPSSVHVSVGSRRRAYEVMKDAAVDPFGNLGLSEDWQTDRGADLQEKSPRYPQNPRG